VTGEAASRTPVLYLHGFASSPESTKARFFGERLAARGVPLRTPDFNEPDFRTLTMSRMLERLAFEIDAAGGRATLMGSSLGAALAVLAAAQFGVQVDRLVLMAPAVMIARPGHALLPDEQIEEWRRAGALPFFHYAYNEPRLLDFAFHEDVRTRDVFAARFDQPALVLQGRRDTVVDPGAVQRFAEGRANVTLSMLDDDHQLAASLPVMWRLVAGFLDLNE
jgi:pimeloyl-ACP methyl ester carboxylesterase